MKFCHFKLSLQADSLNVSLYRARLGCCFGPQNQCPLPLNILIVEKQECWFRSVMWTVYDTRRPHFPHFNLLLKFLYKNFKSLYTRLKQILLLIQLIFSKLSKIINNNFNENLDQVNFECRGGKSVITSSNIQLSRMYDQKPSFGESKYR